MRAQTARCVASLLLYLGLSFVDGAAWAVTTRVEDVRLWSGPEGTRLVIESNTPVQYDVFTLDNPHRVVVDLASASLGRASLPSAQGPVTQVRSGPRAGGGLRLVLDLDSPQAPRSFVVGRDAAAGHRLVIELPGKASSVVAKAAPPPSSSSSTAVATTVPAPATATPVVAPSPAVPTGNEVLVMAAATSGAMAPPVATPRINDVPLAPPVKSATSGPRGRELVIAIDAGHGGQDPGAIGRGGTREKDVTLAIARKLAAAIDAEEGMRAVLIRDGDHFISLGGRTRKARQLGADMFISIHADSVRRREVSGSSVYVLSLRGASDEAARWLAESENAADLKGGVPLAGDDLLASVLLDVTQKEAISDSVEAAGSVLTALGGVGTVHGVPRVRHAGFVVLKSPDIPSMLVETGFISNAGDERRLRNASHQQAIANAIRAGVRTYWHENPPPGTRLAALVAAQRGR